MQMPHIHLYFVSNEMEVAGLVTANVSIKKTLILWQYFKYCDGIEKHCEN